MSKTTSGIHKKIVLTLLCCYLLLIAVVAVAGFRSIREDVMNNLVQTYHGYLFNTSRELESLF